MTVGVFDVNGVCVAVGVFARVGVVLGCGVGVVVGVGVWVAVGAGVSFASCEVAVGISVEGKALHAASWSEQAINMISR